MKYQISHEKRVSLNIEDYGREAMEKVFNEQCIKDIEIFELYEGQGRVVWYRFFNYLVALC